MGLAPIGSTDEHSSPVLPEGRVDAHGLVAGDRRSAHAVVRASTKRSFGNIVLTDESLNDQLRGHQVQMAPACVLEEGDVGS